jgi:hypothetical protein
MDLMPTPKTGELRLRAAIPFIDKATLGTGATTVPGVHKDHRDTRPLGLVADKRPQLAEAPRGRLVALAFANRHPVADVRQIFEHKRGFCVFLAASITASATFGHSASPDTVTYWQIMALQ